MAVILRNTWPDSPEYPVKKFWDQMDSQDLQAIIYDYDFFSPNNADEANQMHIKEGWDMIMPGLYNVSFGQQ